MTAKQTLLLTTVFSSNKYEKRVAKGTIAAAKKAGTATPLFFRKPVHRSISNTEIKQSSATRMLISTVLEKIKHGKMAISHNTDVIILTSKTLFSQFYQTPPYRRFLELNTSIARSTSSLEKSGHSTSVKYNSE